MGSWGSLIADVVELTPGLELIGVANGTYESSVSHASARGVRAYGSVQDVWDDDNVTAVVVAVPNHLHVPLAFGAIRAGKHVLLEKPMAHTVEEAEDLDQRAQRAGLVLMVSHIQRYYSPLAALHELVGDGVLGEVQGVMVNRREQLVRTKGWLQQREYVGGLLYQSGCHEFDLLRWLCGEVTEISCLAGPQVIAPEPLDYPDLILSQLRFESGAVGQVWNCMSDTLMSYDGVVIGKAGTAWFNLYHAQLRWTNSSGITQERSWLPADAWSPVAWLRSGGIAEGEAGSLRALLEDFRDAVTKGATPLVTGLDGARAVEIAQAGYLSIAEQRPVALPLSGPDRSKKAFLDIHVGSGTASP
jgi:UDP-N-acetylglucosamine 3-dehydrogenase